MHKFDFTSAAHSADPQPVFDEMRRLGAVVPVKLPLLGKVFMTTSHEATSALLKDDARFRMRNPKKSGKAVGTQWWMPKTITLLANNMLTSDGDDHRRLRRLVDQAFQRRTVHSLEKMIEKTANDLLDQIERRSGVGRPIDIVDAYARQLPLAVICVMLGIPDEDRSRFSQLAASLSTITGVFDFLRAIRPIGQMRRMLIEIIDRERKSFKSGKADAGLIATLVAQESDGDNLDEDELIAMVFLLLLAGHETTTHAISTSLLSILRKHDALPWLEEDPARYDLAIEELLRINSPVQFSKPRYVMQSGDFFGTQLREGDTIMACLGAANRDPGYFENADELDLTRKPNPHLEFGTGIHFCLGLQLARLEMKIALRVLFQRFPNLALSDVPCDWQSRLGLRALKELHIVLE